MDSHTTGRTWIEGFGNRLLRRIFGPKKEDVAGIWRRLHNEELHNLYASPNIIGVIKSRRRWVGHVVCIGEMRNSFRVLIGKSEGKRPLERHWHRLEDNINMDLRGKWWKVVSIYLCQDRDQ
jgi:hypothetical protein